MPRPRKDLISIADTPYYHVISRCVRRAFLCGTDTLSGQCYEHRRKWIRERIQTLQSVFAIDIASYAVMSNHFHLVVRVNPERLETVDHRVICEHWGALFRMPPLVDRWLKGEAQSQAESDKVLEIISVWRTRLLDLSWFMRCLNEHIARRANAEDGCTGRFFEGRFKSRPC